MNLSSIFRIALVAICCAGFATTSSAQEQRFVMKLDQKLIDSFRTYGSLKSVVREDARDQIGYIELQFSDTENSPAVVESIGVSVQENQAMIVLDDALITKVKGQPIRIRVDENVRGFEQVLLVYDAPSALTKVPEIKDATGKNMDIVFVRLNNGEVMAGGINDFDNIDVNTKFGSVSIPVAQIAGIRMHIDDQDSATIVMANGDTVTGIPTMSTANLTTDWGEALIEAESIRSITMVPDSRFRKEDTDFGPRWVLDTGTAMAPATPPGG